MSRRDVQKSGRPFLGASRNWKESIVLGHETDAGPLSGVKLQSVGLTYGAKSLREDRERGKLNPGPSKSVLAISRGFLFVLSVTQQRRDLDPIALPPGSSTKRLIRSAVIEPRTL